MNRCPNPSYNRIPCPYALSGDFSLPCTVPTDAACKIWRDEYKREVMDSVSPEEAKELEGKLLTKSHSNQR